MKTLLITAATLIIGFVVVLGVACGWFTSVPLEVGPDTTVLEGPLRDDGTVNYAAGLNAKLSEGVTSSNNAFVVIAELMALDEWPESSPSGFGSFREATFHHLGVPMPGDEASYFEGFATYARARAEAEEEAGPWGELLTEEQVKRLLPEAEAAELLRRDVEWEAAQQRPWSAEDLPLVAGWLETQHEALDRLAEGVQRPQYWSPYVSVDPGEAMPAVMLPHLSKVRAMAQALTARAMLRVEGGDLDGAIADVVAVKQLSRHLYRMATLIEQLVGLAVAGLTRPVVEALVADPSLSVEQARTLEAEWQAMAGRAPLGAAVDLERFMVLDALQRPEYYGPEAFEGAADDILLPVSAIDRNRALREANALYDRLVEAVSARTLSERQQEIVALEQELAQRAGEVNPTLARVYAFLRHRGAITELGTARLLDMLVPAVSRTSEAVDRVQIIEQVERVAMAVAGYRAAHGEYPESLEALVPEWIDAVPVDIFDPDGGAIRYRLDEDRVAVYSLGPNQRDAGGVHDRREGDLAIGWER